MNSIIFPGQGSQFTGMGLDLYKKCQEAKLLFEKANDILGFSLSKIMFEGSAVELKQTKIAQVAIFLHSVAKAKCIENLKPDGVAGHSLGEFSALIVSGSLSFEDGISLVKKRALAMQKACDSHPSSMAAILGLEDKIVEEVCSSIQGVVVPANYNCPGQIVISGEIEAIEQACFKAKERGARKVLALKVGGAFHSPLMNPAKDSLEKAIRSTRFKTPKCPIYQNVTALPSQDSEEIKENLISQLTSAVRWTQTIQNMIRDGYSNFIEIGPGNVLKSLVKKIDSSVNAFSGELR